jgi:hypothetical protein
VTRRVRERTRALKSRLQRRTNELGKRMGASDCRRICLITVCPLAFTALGAFAPSWDCVASRSASSETRRIRSTICHDNAPMESFWGSLKTELVHHRRFTTRAEARQVITEYIEIFYNRQRKQARLDYLSPAAFMQRFYKTRLAA